MRKNLRGILGIMLSASMIMSPVMQAMAANQFDVQAEDVAGKLLFPGDSIAGIEPVYLGPDGVVQELIEGRWVNDTQKVYEMSAMEGEQAGLWLQPLGFVLTVNGGTSRVSDTDGSDKSNHFKAKDDTVDTEKDVAYYEAWTDVTVTAGQPQEGKVFDHWEVEDATVTLTDAALAETTFTMGETSVVLTAVYADAPAELPETEAAAPLPETEAVSAEPQSQTEAVTPLPETEAVSVEPQSQTEQAEALMEEAVPDVNGVIQIGANEEAAPNESIAQTYTLTVENGSGSGEYEVGTEITVTAEEKEGMVFTGWTASEDSVWFQDSTSAQTTFPMPAGAVTVTANYEAVLPQLYTVEVENGLGAGSYEAGSTVTIWAGEAPEGMVFESWTTSENIVLEDAGKPEVSFVMPAGDVKATAVYVENKANAETEPVVQPSTEAAETEAVVQPSTEAVSGTVLGAQQETEAAAETEPAVQPSTEAVTEAVLDAEPYLEDEEDEEDMDDEEDTEEWDTLLQDYTESMLDAAPGTTYRLELATLDNIIVEGAAVEDKNDGYGNQLYAAAGTTIKITATEYDDKAFQGWSIYKADGSREQIEVTDDPENNLVAEFVMPEAAVYIEAVYEKLIEAEIISGSGSGTYTEGEIVDIVADDAPEGQRFKEWKVITGNAVLDDPGSEATSFTMPAQPVQIKAVYEVVKYTLTVTNGNGSGSYVMGENISLTANYPASGKVFAGWVVTQGKASVNSADRYYASMTMPAANITVEATYKDGPSPDGNEIQNIVYGGEYLKGSTITFTAAGNGMGNTNPNPGDYRYRPVGYQIGSVSGSWNNAPYKTSMAINAVGEYTLSVNYTKDVYDGQNWVSDGSIVSKSVKFYVVNALSVQTGDNTPVLVMVCVAAVALIAIIVLLILKKRRR